MKIICFSSTGNSRHVALSLAEATRGEVNDMTASRDGEVTDAEAIGIVTPVICGDIPLPVRRYLMHTRLKAPYIFGIITYGYTPGLALKKLGQIFPRASYLASVEMPDSCLTLRHPAKEQERLARLEGAIERTISDIAADISAHTRRKATCSPADYISGFIGKIFHIGRISGSDLHVDPSGCRGCGQCSRLCPARNITLSSTSGIPIIGDDCTGCLTCVNRCPSAALHCRGEKSHSSRYNHPSLHSLNLP